jgi:hypothetical protein
MDLRHLLVEYLTDEQRARFANVSMTPKARKHTDHFFGVGNDVVHGEIADGQGHQHDKSEIHRAVERHLGKEIPTEHYRSGRTTDHLGRETRLGRLIKDAKLRDQFASDSTREGSRKGSTFKTSTHRGIEVAGQTNSAPDAKHPNGHSWGGQSCKNVDTGINRHYLEHEVKHGTIAHFVHDHDGKEIYRATLHPYHSESGRHVVYGVDAEYGIKHPAFTASAHEVAKKLSSSRGTKSTFEIHPDVYNDSGRDSLIHPNAGAAAVMRMYKNDDISLRDAIEHHSIGSTEMKTLISRQPGSNAAVVALHPKADQSVVKHALKELRHSNNNYGAVFVASRAPHHNVDGKELSKLMDNHNIDEVSKSHLLHHPNLPSHYVEKFATHSDQKLRIHALNHPSVTNERAANIIDSIDVSRFHHSLPKTFKDTAHISTDNLHKIFDKVHEGTYEGSERVCEALAQHPNVDAHLISKIVNKQVPIHVVKLALDSAHKLGRQTHHNISTEILDKAIENKHYNLVPVVAKHDHASPEAIHDFVQKIPDIDLSHHMLNHVYHNNPHVKPETLQHLYDRDTQGHHRYSIVEHPKATPEMRKHFSDHVNAEYVAENGNFTSANLDEIKHHAANSQGAASRLLANETVRKPEHISAIIPHAASYKVEGVVSTDAASATPRLKAEHIDQVIKHHEDVSASAILNHPNVSPDTKTKLLKVAAADNIASMVRRDVSRPRVSADPARLTSDDLQVLSDRKDPKIDAHLLGHPNLKGAQLHNLVTRTTERDWVNSDAHEHKNLQPKTISHMLDHAEDKEMMGAIMARHFALKAPKKVPDILKKVPEAAAHIYRVDHVDPLVAHEDHKIREIMATHGDITWTHLQQLSMDPHPDVAAAAHKRMTS